MAPLLVCNIGWMSHYQGLEGRPDKIVGGGRYVDENEVGGEVCNFLNCGDERVFGYVETIKKKKDRRIRLENLGASSDAARIEGVDVVWVATHPDERGRRVVGWYRNATVFRERQEFPKYPSTQHKRDELTWYRVSASPKDCRLLSLEERDNPKLRLGRGRDWIGETNWWFPDRKDNIDVRKFVRSLREYMNASSVDAVRRAHRWGGPGDPDRKAAVELAAVEAVKRLYKGYRLKSVEKDNVGWDLEVLAEAKVIRRIEVKGLFGSAIAVGLTPNEFKAFRRHLIGHEPTYRLAIVAGALSAKPRIVVARFDVDVSQWIDDVSKAPIPISVTEVQSAIVSST